MREPAAGVGVAVPLKVPLAADPVLGPRLIYGSMPIRAVDEEWPVDALLFPTENETIGRVTFEGLDAIRAARGEVLPYERSETELTAGEWVYVIERSSWLEERHRYEARHYDTPLRERYDHYLFSFHDDFVDAIALGIWFDTPDSTRLLARPPTHPLDLLPEATVTDRSTSFGIEWESRVNRTPIADLVEASRLCSQRVIQYNLILDGHSKEHASVWLRTRRDRSVSSFVTGPFGRNRMDAPGQADAATFAEHWFACVEAVAARRRHLGLQ